MARLRSWPGWQVRSSRRRARPLRRQHILPPDLEDFLPKGEAREAFAALDVDGDGKISTADIRQAVQGIFQASSL